jgi:nucleotide-binding universal stress UspA family protein
MVEFIGTIGVCPDFDAGVAAMLKFKKILCTTDFSEASFEAVKHAVSLARSTQSKLILIYVVNQKMLSEGLSLARVSSPEALGKEMADEARRRLKGLIPAGERDGVDWETAIRSGNPAQEVIRYAKENGVDMIVIGTAGHSGIDRMMFGSTAEKVVRGAHCSVLTVRPPAANP